MGIPKNLPRNPVQAYLKGRRETNEDGFLASNLLFLLSYYNVIDNHVKTKKTQIALINAIEKEMDRLFEEEFERDIDKVGIAVSNIPKIRKYFNMEDL